MTRAFPRLYSGEIRDASSEIYLINSNLLSIVKSTLCYNHNPFFAEGFCMERKSILVTGGSGFIGRNFSISALDMGARVTVLTRTPDVSRGLLPAGVSLIRGLTEIDDRDQFDTVVNLAGEPLADRRWTKARKRLFIDSRINTTKSILEFFRHRDSRPSLIISGSAVGYYGHSTQPLDERSSGIDGFSHQLCKNWEASASGFESIGCRVCYLRIGIVLGEAGALARMLPAFRLGLGGPLGSGEQYMSWVHRDDVIALIHHCMNDSKLKGPINATAPNPVTNREFSQVLGTVLSRPAILRMPSMMVKALFGEMGRELLLSGQHVFPKVALDSNFVFQHPKLGPALRNLLS